MNKKQLIDFHNNIFIKYIYDMNIVFENLNADDFSSYPASRHVIVPRCVMDNPTEWSLFAFLHEIGHVMTYVKGQKRCHQEYLATQWAIEEAKNIGFNIPDRFINTYQKYIYKWRETGIKHGAKNMPSIEDLKLTII